MRAQSEVYRSSNSSRPKLASKIEKSTVAWTATTKELAINQQICFEWD